MKHWRPDELATLRALRERFLAGTAGERDYWTSQRELEVYDATFAERIGWKWDAVLDDLDARGWRPRCRRVVDWGCGTGVASRRVLARWPGCFDELALHDRSPLARRFAAARVSDTPTTDSLLVTPDTLVLISHVLNELRAAALASLLAVARQAGEIIWVEAGTHAESRRLISEVREALLPEFAAVAPCTHQVRCGMLAVENTQHWCHHFAAIPVAVFQDARWAEFSRELGIDLRSLPYSFLVLERAAAHRPMQPGCSRVVGRPREAKGYCRVLSCDECGVRDLMLQKRDAPELFRAFHKGHARAVYRWITRDGRIVGDADAARAEQSP